ncbi:GNAT family N-acetyltransferase [Paenibacillus lautus]|uniref:GNAT family N-acetyltransferase n=1 Tax=Paenibacillus lautus TaxID=1401 RepID=UPI003D289F16
MTRTPITIEPMHSKYNSQVSRLYVHGFHGKFQTLTNMNEDELALFFEKYFDQYPTNPASQRMIALQDGEVIGTISIKRKIETSIKNKQRKFSWKSFKSFGKWNVFKMSIGLYLFDYKPQDGECYIADVVVHPDHRSKGVGKLLMQWVQDFVQAEPNLDRLSLHVSGKNPRARFLYERLSFHTHLQENSIFWHFLFNEKEWYYMVMKIIKT